MISGFELRLGALCERKRPFGQARAEALGLAEFLEAFARKFSNRLEHEEPAFARLPQQALVDERREAVEVDLDNRFGCLEREAAGKDRHAGELRPFGLVEQLMAPFDRRAERPLSLRRVARPSRQELEPAPESTEDLGRRQDLYARGGQLDGEREAVKSAADLGYVAIGLEPPAQRLRPQRVSWTSTLFPGPRQGSAAAANSGLRGLRT